MSEQRQAEPSMLLLAALALGLGVWWISGGDVAVGVAWIAIALGTLAAWFVRRRPGPTPWWARSVRWADVRSRLRRT